MSYRSYNIIDEHKFPLESDFLNCLIAMWNVFEQF